ncbi:MAG TPA: hypothetical protein PLN78_00385, partial [Pseudomonadales bacterium]|nr:hypothetical protein [Pseudomonadales bacterium]
MLASVQENRANLAAPVDRLLQILQILQILQTVSALWQYCTTFVSWCCPCVNAADVRERGGYIPVTTLASHHPWKT